MGTGTVTHARSSVVQVLSYVPPDSMEQRLGRVKVRCRFVQLFITQWLARNEDFEVH